MFIKARVYNRSEIIYITLFVFRELNELVAMFIKGFFYSSHWITCECTKHLKTKKSQEDGPSGKSSTFSNRNSSSTSLNGRRGNWLKLHISMANIWINNFYWNNFVLYLNEPISFIFTGANNLNFDAKIRDLKTFIYT